MTVPPDFDARMQRLTERIENLRVVNRENGIYRTALEAISRGDGDAKAIAKAALKGGVVVLNDTDFELDA